MATALAGRRFPEIVVADIDGAPCRAPWPGIAEPLLLAVGHADCPTTRLALPCVERLHRLRGRGSVVLLVQEEPAGARALVEQMELTVPLLLDRDPYPAVTRLGLEVVPTLILIEGGDVRSVSEGFSRDDLEGLARVLGVPGRLVRPEDAPAWRPG